MPDERIKLFTNFYHLAYQNTFGVPYKWKGGKEQKLMQGALKYFENIGGLDAMKEACLIFLATKEPFLQQRAYDLSDFLTKPEKWALKLKEKQEADSKREANLKAYQAQHKASEDKGKAHSIPWLDQMGQDPERFLKNFKFIHKYMKNMNPEVYQKVRSLMLDFYGAEYLKKHW